MRASTAILLAIVAIAIIVLWGFRPEAAALGWHLQHGMHAEGAGLRLRVPLFYTSIGGPDSLILMTQDGSVRSRLSGSRGVLIMMSKKLPAAHGDETTEQWWKRTSDAITREGAHQTAARSVSVAGRSERCMEFEGGFLVLGVDIWCVPDSPGGWIVDYTGPRSRVPQFYQALESAQPH